MTNRSYNNLFHILFLRSRQQVMTSSALIPHAQLMRFHPKKTGVSGVPYTTIVKTNNWLVERMIMVSSNFLVKWHLFHRQILTIKVHVPGRQSAQPKRRNGVLICKKKDLRTTMEIKKFKERLISSWAKFPVPWYLTHSSWVCTFRPDCKM